MQLVGILLQVDIHGAKDVIVISLALVYQNILFFFLKGGFLFMSKMSKAVSGSHILGSDKVTNYMGGTSYTLNPLQTLKMIAASSIFGEPQYYRSAGFKKKESYQYYRDTELMSDILFKDIVNGHTATDIFTNAIDKSLAYDFEGTLALAIELRKTYNMRLNPQVIMVRAAIHPARQKYTKKNPGKFDQINQIVMSRADEPMSQLAYYIYATGSKKDIPSILKRSIASKLSKLDAYSINKYKTAEIGMINAIRIVHANSPVINELMKTGSVTVDSVEDITWEQKRSAGMSWHDILSTTKLGHMALLRNLRNIFQELDWKKSEDHDLANNVLRWLKAGVLKGKQFPFRYQSAMNAVKGATNIEFKSQIMDALEECMDIAIDNLPKLKGRTMCLSDNSGSAWGAFTSEYGETQIAKIDNLSSVIAAKCSDEGIVGKFGDKLIEFPISKRGGILSQTEAINSKEHYDVGASTEGGIWEFFYKAIEKKEWFDNIFIFSDMQAGTGGLYGTIYQRNKYYEYGVACKGGHIDVYKLVQMYRQKVNPKVNVFSVQTAGYDNVVIPMMAYRCAMLTGWTGKEIQFAAEYIKQWDEVEAQRDTVKKKSSIDEQVDRKLKNQTFQSEADERRARTQMKERIVNDSYGDRLPKTKTTSSYKYNKKRDFDKYKK